MTKKKVLKKQICSECGYTAQHLVPSKDCPMCEPCPRCKRKLMRCECIEGE